jgi:hypothetical protein
VTSIGGMRAIVCPDKGHFGAMRLAGRPVPDIADLPLAAAVGAR